LLASVLTSSTGSANIRTPSGVSQRQLTGDCHLLIERHAGKVDVLAPADLNSPAIGSVAERLGRVEVAVPELMLAGLGLEGRPVVNAPSTYLPSAT
jgi:hypothetical protein